MAKSSRTDGVLAGVRVLDLTGADGLLAGQILADLGADVVQAIAPSRQSDSVGDYHWRAYTRGKRLLEIDPARRRRDRTRCWPAQTCSSSRYRTMPPRGCRSRRRRSRHGIRTSYTCRSRRSGAAGRKPDYAATRSDDRRCVRISVRVRRGRRNAGADLGSASARACRRRRGGGGVDRAARGARPAHRRLRAAFDDARAAGPRPRRRGESAARRTQQRLRHGRRGTRALDLSGARRLGAGVGGHRAAGGGVHAEADELGGRGKALRRRVDRLGLGHRGAAHGAGLVQRGGLADGRRRDRAAARAAHESRGHGAGGCAQVAAGAGDARGRVARQPALCRARLRAAARYAARRRVRAVRSQSAAAV